MVKREVRRVMKVSPDELLETADEFHRASKETEVMVSRLNQAMKKLEETWSDAGQQVFYQYYKEWQQHMGGFSLILDLVAKDLKAIAERYSDADS